MKNTPLINIQRFAVIGTTGSGKTTLSSLIAERRHIPHIEIDALYWKSNWSHAEHEELRTVIDQLTCTKKWVVDGNYGFCRDIVWGRAQAVVWLDYPLWKTFQQLLFRTLERSRSHELLWGTNYENMGDQLKIWSNDSLFLWLFKTYWKHRRQYPSLLASREYCHLSVFRLRSRTQTENWLQALEG